MWALALVGILSSVAGGLIQAYSAWKKGNADYRFYNDLASSAESKIGEVEKTAEVKRGFTAEKQYRETDTLRGGGREFAASQEAAMAGSGAGAGSVVTQDVVSDTFAKKAMDEALIAHNADLERWSISRDRDSEVADLKDKARQYRMSGRNAVEAGGWSAGASILGTASSTANALISTAPYLR